MSDVIIKEMILDAPDQVVKLDASINNIDEQISSFEDKRDSIKGSVCDKVSTDLESYLMGTKFAPVSNYYIQKGSNYNQSLISSGNITDWKVYEIVINVYVTCFSTTEFVTEGNTTSDFIPTEDISFILLSTSIRVYSTISSSTYDAENNKTTVVIDDAVLDSATFLEVWKFKYTYIISDDPIIDNFKTQWDFGHDYLVLPMGTSGTYGILDNIAKLTLAKNLLFANRTKVNDSITILAPFE
jgi:hypothetical protein